MTKDEPGVEAVARADAWWSSVCRKGDPARRPCLVDEAFQAGWEAASLPQDKRIAVLEEALKCAEVTLRLDGERMSNAGMSTQQNAEAHRVVSAALNGGSNHQR